MRFLRAGGRAVLVELDDLGQVIELHAALRREPPAGIVDLVPAARTVLLTHDAATSYERLVAELTERAQGTGAAGQPGTVPTGQPEAVTAGPAGEVVEIPVDYTGADLAEVARLTGLGIDEVIRRHQQAEYVVAFVGFAPGFGYLVGGDPALRVPRRSSPRTRVPAGSVALAGEFTGVYPREGPGGWQLLGRTDIPLWDLDRQPPALLAPGTRVRFVASGDGSGSGSGSGSAPSCRTS